MKTADMFSKSITKFVLLAIILGTIFAGCKSESPVRVVEEEIDWPDLSQPEDVIETIRLVYENFNSVSSSVLQEHYAAVLNDDPADANDYLWHMRPQDVSAEIPEIMYRSEDIEGTMYIINNASSLNLVINPGNWDTATDVCEECLITTRTYMITTTMNHRGEIYDLSGTDFRVQFVVGPSAADPEKWAIYIAADLNPAGM